MINFRHITLASNFYTTKFSANRQNTEYTVGNRTDRIVQGTPSVLYDEVVFCKELKIIYTHGAFYEANSAQFDLDAFVTRGELIDNYVNKTDFDNYYTKPQTDNTFVKKSTLENNYYDKDTTFDLFVTKNRLISDYFNKSDIEENYYTKRQTNNLLDQKQDIISGEGVISVEDNVVKADLSDYYNKSEVDTKLDQKQDIISGEGVISVENNVVKADLSNYYDKSEVYTKQETDNLLDQKQDIISGEGVISVENNVVSADLSDYYNKETVDNKLATKQNLISGNPGEVLYHNGSEVFTQEVLGENLVVTTQTDLDKCKNISVVDPSFVIFDLVNSAVLTFDSATSTWVPVAGQNPIELLGAGRFSYNNVTNKLFYNNGSKVIELSQLSEELNLATVATTGNYNDLLHKPTIPTKTSQLTNDSGFINTIDSTLSDSSTNPVQNKVITDAISNKQDKLSTSGTNVHLVDNVLSVDDNSIVYKQGKGIEINEDNEISIVQNDEVTETPVTDDKNVNIFFNYNGTKVIVPQGNGYFNLLHNYRVSDYEGDQIFKKGLYIEDDLSTAPSDWNYLDIVKTTGLQFTIKLSSELVEHYRNLYPSSDLYYAWDDLFSSANTFSFLNADEITPYFHFPFAIQSYGVGDSVTMGIGDISGFGNTDSNIRGYIPIKYPENYSRNRNNSVESNKLILRKNDYFIDILGNIYKIYDISYVGNAGSISNSHLNYSVSYIMEYCANDTISIILTDTHDHDRLSPFIGKEVAKITLLHNNVTNKPVKISVYDYTSDIETEDQNKFIFESAYKNEDDRICYIYKDDTGSEIAVTKRKYLGYSNNTVYQSLIFCGFLSYGYPTYHVEPPIQYTTENTELQGFSWITKSDSIDADLSLSSVNAVQNKVITNELVKIRTEFVPHYIELPSDGNKGDIVQYIGYTNDYFTNGYFYKCDNIIIPPKTNYISLNNDYPKFKRGVYTEIENPTDFSNLGIVQVIIDGFYGDYTIAEGQDEYGTLFNFPSIRFDFFGVPDKTNHAELMHGLDYIQVGELAADEAGNLYRISEVDPSSRIPTIKVKLEVYQLAYDFTLERESEPDVTYKLSDILSQILSETWISIDLTSSTSIQYSLFKTFSNYRGDTIYAYKYSSGTSMTGPMYCCSTKLVDGVVRPTFAGFLYWSNWVQTIYIETGSLTIKPQIYTSGNVSVTSEHLGWSQIDVQPNDGGGVISYNDLIDKPTIPTKTSQLTNDSGFSTFSGSYNDLTDKPTIPQVDNELSDSSSNAVENRVAKSAIDNKITNGGGVTTEIALTKSEYNSIPTKDDNTVYIITDEPADESNVVFKVCVVGQNTTNISDLVQPYSLIPNNVVILTNLEDNKTYEYTLNNTTKTFEGDSEHDMLFRYIGNNEFKPIVFGAL